MKKIFTFLTVTAISVSVVQAQRISSFTLEGITALGPSAAFNPTNNDEKKAGDLQIVFPNTVDFSNVTPVFDCGADAAVTTSPVPTDFTTTQKVKVEKNDGSSWAMYEITCKKINPAPLPFILPVGEGFTDDWDQDETLGWAGARLDRSQSFPRFGGANANLIIAFSDAPDLLSFSINAANENGMGEKAIFDVEESADGIEWKELIKFDATNPMAGSKDAQEEKDKEVQLDAETRYVRFVYTNRDGVNVALTSLSVTKAEDGPGGPSSIGDNSNDRSIGFVVNESNDLLIEGAESITELSLTNVAGQVALVQTNPAAITNLNMLSGGVYIVKITTNDGNVKTGKIVVR